MTVEPKPGAGGILAVNDLSQSPQDGYTLLVGVSSLVPVCCQFRGRWACGTAVMPFVASAPRFWLLAGRHDAQCDPSLALSSSRPSRSLSALRLYG